MRNQARFRALGICAIALLAYGLLFHKSLEARLPGAHELFFAGLSIVIVVSGWYLEARRASVRITWALLSPVVGSIVGYAIYAASVFVKRGAIGDHVSVSAWIVAFTVYPYVICDAWTLSLALPILTTVNHLGWPRNAVEGKPRLRGPL